MPLPHDTTLEAARVQFAVLRKLGPEGRDRLGAELSEGVRTVLAEGIRQRHPDYTDEQVRWAMLRALVGDTLFLQAFPDKYVSL